MRIGKKRQKAVVTLPPTRPAPLFHFCGGISVSLSWFSARMMEGKGGTPVERRRNQDFKAQAETYSCPNPTASTGFRHIVLERR
jgi:hypothetical protein